jgi:tRNA A58 N-methylase Trm61
MSALQEQYALGRSPQEYARLARQAEILKPMTRRLFAEAGIEPGMRVLDLGSGAGDIYMLLTEMVGSGGSIIGLDIDQDALLHAQERVTAAGLSNITFVHSDFAHYVPKAPVDAIVGSLVGERHKNVVKQHAGPPNSPRIGHRDGSNGGR